MAKSRSNKTKERSVAFVVVIVFIISFGMGFFTNDFLNSNAKSKTGNVIQRDLMGDHGSVTVVAVTEDGTGVIGRANIEIIPGRGRILANTNPFIEPDTQQSVETAVSYALNYTNTNLNDFDIIVSFDINDLNGNPIDSRGQIIGGPSAGAALTLATIAAIEGREIKDGIAITGTIEPDGSIGRIGSVAEKSDAAGKAGLSYFLVPQGQAGVREYERVVTMEKTGPFTIRRVSYVPSIKSLDSYTIEKYNMSVIEVSRVEDAFSYVFEN